MGLDMVKGKPLSKDETKALLQLIEMCPIITKKTTNATNNKSKTEEWTRITNTFNAQQLRLKWENLKNNSRKRSTKIRMNHIQSGRGAGEYIPPDEVLNRVADLLGSTASGFVVPFGGDKEPDVFVIGGGGGGSDGGVGCDEFVPGEAQVLNVEKILKLSYDPVGAINNVISIENASGITPEKPYTFNNLTPRFGKRKRRPADRDESVSARNEAIAEYFKKKKEYLDAKMANILLQNTKLKLEEEHLTKNGIIGIGSR